MHTTLLGVILSTIHRSQTTLRPILRDFREYARLLHLTARAVMNQAEEAALNGHSDRNGIGSSSMSPGEAGPSSSTSGMSKNAMKKAAKLARFEANKPARRAAEKARRKERNAVRMEAYDAGTMSVEERALIDHKREIGRLKKAARRKAEATSSGSDGKDWQGGVIIDLGFDDLMLDGEIKSMASQLGYVYSANRLSSRPFARVVHTSFSSTNAPKLYEAMKGGGRERWTRTVWWPGSLEDLTTKFRAANNRVDHHSVPTDAGPDLTSAYETGIDGEEGSNNGSAKGEAMHREVVASNSGLPWSEETHKLVYLSADADDELETLREDEVYIIGGLVDRNRHKMICQNKAVNLGVHTARLPIGKFIDALPTRKVLTVNQVFDTLVQYITLGDWAEAFEAVIPQRKYQAVSKRAEKRKARRALSQDGSHVGGMGDEGQSSADDDEIIDDHLRMTPEMMH